MRAHGANKALIEALEAKHAKLVSELKSLHSNQEGDEKTISEIKALQSNDSLSITKQVTEIGDL
jgi:hypothetical protein